MKIGDRVLVRLDVDTRRPLIVSAKAIVNTAPPMQPEALQVRVSGSLFCEPEDHSTPALRGLVGPAGDPARFHGRPERHAPVVYAEALQYGPGIGQWLPSGGGAQ